MTTGCSCHATAGYCQCLLDDTNCIETTGTDPYEAEFVIDPDDANLLSSSPAGLKVLLPRVRTNPPTAGARRSEELKIKVGDTFPIPFDVQMWDNFSVWTADAASRETAPADGMYIATGHCRWPSQTGGFRSLSITKQGGLEEGTMTQWATSSPSPQKNPLFLTAQGLFRLDEGQFVELWVFQTSIVSNLPLELNNHPYTCSLSLIRVGDYA